MTFGMEEIPAGFQRGWKLFVDGHEVNASKVELISNENRFGRVTYGLRPEGYDSWIYKNRVAAVTVPYCIMRTFRGRRLMVGLVSENRPNMGGHAFCAIGGFTDPGETLEQAQAREANEEAGMEGRARCISRRIVTDRLFWDASQEGFGGNYVFVKKIARKDIEYLQGFWRPRYGGNAFKDFAKASGVVFFEWSEAVDRTRDGIAIAALAHVRRAYDRGEL